ncbi:phosphodiesterase [Oceanisphaera marina]|uniref:Phosphodiesterase n=1 Tax=Oceanisphaera marina TaxID=2017550 RepID=A0ABQ1ILN6_9GAMM|nr:HD domain-containing phosphohydrolase [Oceanisphaera marina]GGB44841.1 phosphodiesterase [Oceanisphaera marina]
MPLIHARFSLRVYISCLFSILIILLGSVLIYAQHRHNSSYVMANSQQRLAVLEQQLSQRLSYSLQNINTALTLMQSNNVTLAATAQDPGRWWPLLRPLLAANPHVVRFYVGEPDGRGLFFHRVADQPTHTSFTPPLSTRLILDIMAPGLATQRFYFDQDDQQLNQTEVNATENIDPFDVRSRPWYSPTLSRPGMHLTAPYLFHGSNTPGLTLSVGDADQQRVWAADLQLTDLNSVLDQGLPGARILLLQAPGLEVLADSTAKGMASPLSAIQDLSGFSVLTKNPDLGSWQHETAGETWLGQQQPLKLDIPAFSSLDLRLATLIPYRTLMVDALRFNREQAWLTLLIVILSLPLVIMASRAISRPMKHIADDMKAIQAFDFTTLKQRRYFYKELDEQAQTMTMMSRALAGFIKELHSLSQSDDFNNLLQRVATGITHLSNGRRCLIYRARQQENEHSLELLDKHRQHRITLPDLAEGHDLSAFMLQTFADQALRFEPPWLLYDRFGQLNGAIMLGMRHGAPALSAGKRRFIAHYCDFANIALEDMSLFEQQQRMTESMIRVLATGIDAKSPHTSKHCQRVPELTLMLARAAHHSQTGDYADFHLSDQQWEALYLAAWLHDCGKLVTPEHVLNKATKLETLYNRIHEIRTRFEVLKRDADIRYWQGLANGENEAELAKRRQQQQQQLDDDFAFIAQLNKGDIKTGPDQQARLTHIAEQRWLRTLNNRLGLSWEEEQRLGHETPLPVWESLLDDKPEHHVPYLAKERIEQNNSWQITMLQPRLKQHLGERYNLAIAHGTLTAEERYIINAHVVHTLIMLSELHYPAHLSDVPVLAASHHERMDGTGYPRGIKAGDLPLQARIMALADVFEALTASDRPYKQANSLQKTLSIMANMVKKQHLDPVLFRFFVEQEIYLQYASQYLAAEQQDQINKQQVLAAAGLQPTTKQED